MDYWIETEWGLGLSQPFGKIPAAPPTSFFFFFPSLCRGIVGGGGGGGGELFFYGLVVFLQAVGRQAFYFSLGPALFFFFGKKGAASSFSEGKKFFPQPGGEKSSWVVWGRVGRFLTGWLCLNLLPRKQIIPASFLHPKRTIAELKELRALTGDENGAQRVAFTPNLGEGARLAATKAGRSAGVEIHNDEAGNLWATLRGESDKALLIGGHIDSVPNGGWLDGCLNTMAGVEILAAHQCAIQRQAAGHSSAWSIGPMKKARALGKVFSVRPPARARST